MRAFVADQPDTTVCSTCRDEGRILAMWDRPGGPPGNGYVGCPYCEKGRAYTEAIQKEMERCLQAERTGWAPTGAQLALELAQNPLTDDESFLQWVERHANRYIEAARQRTDHIICGPDYFAGMRTGADAERARCAAWAKLYWDGDLTDDYEMYVGIRDGKPPPNQVVRDAPQMTTAEGLAFALLGCLDFGPEGKSMPTFRPEAIRLIQEALDKAQADGNGK